jgi:hypothetical protein
VCRYSRMVNPDFGRIYCMLIYTHCRELMKSVGSYGSSALPFRGEGYGLTLCGYKSFLVSYKLNILKIR